MLSFTLTPKAYAKVQDIPITVSRFPTPHLITRITKFLEVDETASTASFTLELSKKPSAGGKVAIQCVSTDITEVLVKEPSNGIIVLSPDDQYKSKRVMLHGVADNVDDGDQFVEVMCSVISGQQELKGVNVTVSAVNKNVDKAEILVSHEPGAFTS